MRALRPADLTRLLWGFARLGHHPGRLLDAAAGQLCDVLPDCPAPLLPRLLWSFQQFQHMGYRNEAIMVALAQELPRAARGPETYSSW